MVVIQKDRAQNFTSLCDALFSFMNLKKEFRTKKLQKRDQCFIYFTDTQARISVSNSI